MNAPFRPRSNVGPSLSEVYPPFGEKLKAYFKMMESDPEKAEALFAEAQIMAKAFHAGIEFARRGA